MMIKREYQGLLTILLIILSIVFTTFMLTNKTSPQDTWTYLTIEKDYSSVVTGDREFFECSRYEWTGINFKALDKQGNKVEGVACENIFTGTIKIRT
jgi:uncharacterized protein YxeA